MKTLVTAVALATLIAAPAFARTPERPAAHPNSSQAIDHGGQYGARNSGDVIMDEKTIGHDPDPWIRNEILRHYDFGLAGLKPFEHKAGQLVSRFRSSQTLAALDANFGVKGTLATL